MEYIYEENRIYLQDELKNTIAEITFTDDGNTCCIDHTFVDDCLRGQGIAKVLAQKAFDYIESKGKKVTATCSYAAHYLEKKKKKKKHPKSG